MSINKYFRNYIADTIGQEIKTNVNRIVDAEKSKITSLSGRAVCLLMLPVHLAGIVIKPYIYTCSAISNIICGIILFNLKDFKEGLHNAVCIIVSPIGQMLQVAKAALGILIPAAYFKENIIIWPDVEDNVNYENFEECINSLTNYLQQLDPADFEGRDHLIDDLNDLNRNINNDRLNGYALNNEMRRAIKQGIAKLAKGINDPAVAPENKAAALQYLGNEGGSYQLRKCVAGVINAITLAQSAIGIPRGLNRQQLHDWLLEDFKMQCIQNICVNYHYSSTHSYAGIILALRDTIGLTEEHSLLGNDDHVDRLIDRAVTLRRFNALYTTEGFVHHATIFFQGIGNVYQEQIRQDIVNARYDRLTPAEVQHIQQVKLDPLNVDMDDEDKFYWHEQTPEQQKGLLFQVYYSADPDDRDCTTMNHAAIAEFCGALRPF